MGQPQPSYLALKRRSRQHYRVHARVQHPPAANPTTHVGIVETGRVANTTRIASSNTPSAKDYYDLVMSIFIPNTLAFFA